MKVGIIVEAKADKMVYVYKNALGHRHVSLNELTEDEMAINFYELKRKMKLTRYLMLMNIAGDYSSIGEKIKNEFDYI